MNFKKIVFLKVVFFSLFSSSQNLEKIGKSPLFKLSGGVAVNSVYYAGDANREPFTYFLSGNVNLNISDVYNVPFSFSYSNSKFQTNNPFTFNRLSLHPSYKWITAHIGDVSMTFSPYTLNGHQFTGLGFDLSPKDKFKVSVMYGRLLKEREFNEENINGEANYKRMGYGLNTSYKFDFATLGFIFFKARDDVNSLVNPIPIETEILPKDNTVISFNGDFNINKQINFKAEVALSALTEDTRVVGESDHFASFLVNSNPTTQYYKAFNLNFNYQVGKGAIGLGYERIDPNYKTLGGYFFNNDLENITVNASQTIFNDRLALNMNAGLQKDDLHDTKASQLNRLVMSFNAAYNASDKLNLTGSYSNFQSFTNIKDQFDFINGVNQIEEQLDQDNITQISQNANLNVNYNLEDTPNIKQNLNFNLSYQDAVNKIADEIREEDNSAFYNANTAYTLTYPETDLSISGAINTSLSQLAESNTLILGPTVSATKGFFEKTLKINSAVSYNETLTDGERQGQVANLRLGGRYVYKKQHNFSLNALFQFRNSISSASSKNFTLTFGYNYSFGLFNSKDIRFRKRKRKPKTNKVKAKKEKKAKKKRIKKPIRFKFRDSLYNGTIPEVDYQITTLINSPLFETTPDNIMEELKKEKAEIAQEENNKAYKIKAIQLLSDLYNTKENMREFNKLLFLAIGDVYRSAERTDYAIEKQFVQNKKEIVKHMLWNKSEKDIASYPKEIQKEYKHMDKVLNKSHKKLLVHRWILSELGQIDSFKTLEENKNLIKDFRNKHASKIFKMLKMKEKKQKIKLYLEALIVDFFAKESESHIDKDQYELKYMDTN